MTDVLLRTARPLWNRRIETDPRQIELPLGSSGFGEYALAVDLKVGDQRARVLAPFRVPQ